MKRKLAFAAVVFTAAVVTLPAVAGAHVEITTDASPGPDGLVATKVVSENECKKQLKTVELLVPETPGLTVATPAAVAGWTNAVTVKPGTQAIASITWTNDGTATGNGNFPLSIGPVPAGSSSLKFKALDTCDDGEVFRWVQDGESSEFPAPVLTIAGTGSQTPETSTETRVPVTTVAKKKSNDSSTGVVIGIVGASLVLIGAGIVMFRRSKK